MKGATGKPFVRHWMHSEFLLVEGEKMSKSKGNQFTVKDLLDEGYSAMAIRYLLLSVYYRQQLNFTRDGLAQAATAIRRVDDFLDRLGEVKRDGEASDETKEAGGERSRAVRGCDGRRLEYVCRTRRTFRPRQGREHRTFFV